MVIQDTIKFLYFQMIRKKTTFHLSIWHICLPAYAFWTLQCTCYFSVIHPSHFSDMVDEFLKVFMDDFSIFENIFDNYLQNLSKVLKCYTKTNLVLNWEKSHFMVRKEIILGHIIFKRGIEVDIAKVEIISKLPPSNLG